MTTAASDADDVRIINSRADDTPTAFAATFPGAEDVDEAEVMLDDYGLEVGDPVVAYDSNGQQHTGYVSNATTAAVLALNADEDRYDDITRIPWQHLVSTRTNRHTKHPALSAP